MSFLYVTEQGGYLRKNGDSATLFREKEKIHEMPVKDLETVVLFGNIQVSTQLLLHLLEKGCDVALMSSQGRFRGRVVASKSKNSEIRIKQFEKSIDPHYCLEVSRRIVKAKILNGLEVLRKYHNSSHSSLNFKGFDRLKEFAAMAESATELEELRGFEGSAARLYFNGFKNCLKNSMGFEGRKYFPSTDPVNALLSFGYSFVSRELQGLLEAAGLDPFIGFFHKVKYGRASLSLDLVEPFRHILVDRLVLGLVNREKLRDKDFHADGKNGAVYLNRDSVKIFIKGYEEFCNKENVTFREDEGHSFRTVFRKEVESLRKALDRETVYEPFTYNS